MSLQAKQNYKQCFKVCFSLLTKPTCRCPQPSPVVVWIQHSAQRQRRLGALSVRLAGWWWSCRLPARGRFVILMNDSTAAGLWWKGNERRECACAARWLSGRNVPSTPQVWSLQFYSRATWPEQTQCADCTCSTDSEGSEALKFTRRHFFSILFCAARCHCVMLYSVAL